MGDLMVNTLLAPCGANPPFVQKRVRVARIEPQKNRIWLCFPGSGRIPRAYDMRRIARALEDESIYAVEDKKPGSVLAYEEAPALSQNKCDAAWDRIQLVLQQENQFFEEDKRAALMRQQASVAGTDLATVYRTLARYYENGQTKHALMPHYRSVDAGGHQPEGQRRRGRPPRIAPPPGEQAFIFTDAAREAVVDLLMASDRFANAEALYAEVIARLYTTNVDGTLVPLPTHLTPTRAQVRRVKEEIDKGFAFTRRQMGNEFNLTIRPIDGSIREAAFGPGAEYQIDATGTQVDLVSAFDRTKPIGRPILYFVVDVFSSMIVGFHLSLQSASWESARFAFFHAFTKKSDFCRRLGLNIEDRAWPAFGLPMRVIADRGELLGQQAELIVKEGLKCDLINARTRRGDDKAYVERMFRTIKKGALESLAGHGPKNRSRNGKNPRNGACLNLFEATRIVARFCLFWNSKRLSEGAIPNVVLEDPKSTATPCGLWVWGQKNLSGQLRAIDCDTLYRRLLPQADATMKADGIHFRGSVYRCNELDAMGARVRARKDGSSEVRVHYDEARADHLWLWLPQRNQLIECFRHDKVGDLADWTFADAEIAAVTRKAKRAKELNSTEDARLGFELARISIQDTARAEKSAAGKTKSKSTQSVRRSRQEEKPFDDERVRHIAGQASRSNTTSRNRRVAPEAAEDNFRDEFFASFPKSFQTI